MQVRGGASQRCFHVWDINETAYGNKAKVTEKHATICFLLSTHPVMAKKVVFNTVLCVWISVVEPEPEPEPEPKEP